MFSGVIIAAVLAILVTVLGLRAIRWVLGLLSGAREKEGKEARRDKPSEDKKASRKEEKAKEAKESVKKEKPQEELSEETRQRYAGALFSGISEEFAPEGTPFRIDGKAIADECVEGSRLTYLEYNNRGLAGDEFHGFNLIVEEDSRIVLTYGGNAVATITKIEREDTAVINGETVTGTVPGYRINTFPPKVKEGTTVTDVERMLDAAGAVKGLNDPETVLGVMKGLFTEEDNVALLKGSIDGKIQAKESSRKKQTENLSRKGPKRLTPKA